MDCFLDIWHASVNKSGEELCGDKVKVFKTERKTIVVLSDGLGSGVKANILATLTSEIIVTMLRADVPLKEVISTVIGTLPVCKERKIAYATFTAIEIDHITNSFKIINFDNPPTFYFHKRRCIQLNRTLETILGKQIYTAEGQLELGDFLGIVSDGILHAGVGNIWNFGWGWDNVAGYLEQLLLHTTSRAKPIVQGLVSKTQSLYGRQVGDDATCVGIYARERHSLMLFTGPPLDETTDDYQAQRLLDFEGRKVVCGGTTGTIMETHLGEAIDIDLSTLREDVPPIGWLSQIDLMTEGIITMSHALDYMRACRGDEFRLPRDRNGATLLAQELLRADSVFFLVGQKINEFYQNPLLPKNLSIRKNLVLEISQFLREHNKEVQIEFC
ncbi:MAG TPA: SpoIIE family protein phosphatase [Phototrophicaceae bacterium]|nr:SpoIIE family protein phosphatase [Phototrophicaceae bacterium]